MNSAFIELRLLHVEYFVAQVLHLHRQFQLLGDAELLSPQTSSVPEVTLVELTQLRLRLRDQRLIIRGLLLIQLMDLLPTQQGR